MNEKASVSKELNEKHRKVRSFLQLLRFCITLTDNFYLYGKRCDHFNAFFLFWWVKCAGRWNFVDPGLGRAIDIWVFLVQDLVFWWWRNSTSISSFGTQCGKYRSWKYLIIKKIDLGSICNENEGSDGCSQFLALLVLAGENFRMFLHTVIWAWSSPTNIFGFDRHSLKIEGGIGAGDWVIYLYNMILFWFLPCSRS